MARLFRSLAISSFILLWANAAISNVLYSFEALSSYSTGAGVLTGNFVFESPTFITTDTNIPAAQITSSSVISDTLGSLTLGDVQFHANNTTFSSPGPYDIIGFGTQSQSNFYYFAGGAFGAVGKYDSLLLGPNQQGTLTVSIAAVPEPETYAMMLIGLGLIGATLKLSKAKNKCRCCAFWGGMKPVVG